MQDKQNFQKHFCKHWVLCRCMALIAFSRFCEYCHLEMGSTSGNKITLDLQLAQKCNISNLQNGVIKSSMTSTERSFNCNKYHYSIYAISSGKFSVYQTNFLLKSYFCLRQKLNRKSTSGWGKPSSVLLPLEYLQSYHRKFSIISSKIMEETQIITLNIQALDTLDFSRK